MSAEHGFPSNNPDNLQSFPRALLPPGVPQETVKQPMDFVGTSGLIDTSLSPRQQSRLQSFFKMAEVINDFGRKTDEGENWHFFVFEYKDGESKDEVKVKAMDTQGKPINVGITAEMIDILRRTALHMYESFEGNEIMTRLANQKILELKDAEQAKKDTEIAKLNTIFETGSDEVF